MNDLTPELLAQVATRMMNELPSSEPLLQQRADTLPTLERGAGMVPLPSPQGFGPASLSPASVVSFAPPGVQAFSPPNFQSSAQSHDAATVSPPAIESSGGDQYAGLRRFVEKVRETGTISRSGICRAGLDPIFGGFARQQGFEQPAGPRPWDVASIRRDFPILTQRVHGQPLAWFDNAATTQKPQSVIDALSRFYAEDNSNIHRGAHTLAARATEAYEQARKKVQRLLNARSPDEIVFVRGTTEGINLVAHSYGRKMLTAGDEIVLPVVEHHANIVPWQMLAQESGAVLRVVPVNDRGEIDLEAYERLLGPRTRLVAMTQASNSLGTVLPVAVMVQMAHRYGARVLVDGAQSVAHMPVDVQQLDADFFVFSGHKIYGPTGIGAVYARQELLDIMAPFQGGGNMIRNVTFEETTYNGPPAKFEAGTPNIADAVGLGAALDYLSQFSWESLQRYEHDLLADATQRVASVPGVRILGTARDKVGVLSFILAQRSPTEVGQALDRAGIAVRAGHHCAQPSLRRFGLEATVRASFSIYNTRDEIDRLVETLFRITRGL